MTRSPHAQNTFVPTEGDSARQVADFAALRRMLVVSEGCFSLSFAVCNDRTLRNELIERLREEFSGLVVVELPDETSNVYQTVCGQLRDGAPRGIIVLDLEASVPSQAKAQPTLRALNRSRELWERFACPVVFWLAEYAAALVARRAPDFWRYRSHLFEFVSDRATVGEAIREPVPTSEMIDGLPFEEKRFRVAELEQRINEAGSPPSTDLLPHALQWLYELAYYYRHTSQFDRTRELLDRAVSWANSAYGQDDPRTAVALSNLAAFLLATDRLSDAEPLMWRALAIDEQNCGNDHPVIAVRLNNLAMLLAATNRRAEAEPLMRRALAIDEESFGKDHPTVATDLNNLAMLLQGMNRLAEAEALMARVVTVFEKSLGENHANMAAPLNNLALLLAATNRLAEAEPLMRRALAIDEQSHGKDHPQVATDLNNLAQLLQTTNRLGEAEPLMRRAIAICEQSFGGNHPNVATSLNNLAQLLKAANRLGEAEPFMRRSVEIFLDFGRQASHQHSDLNTVIRNYELLLQRMGMSQQEIKQRLDELQHAIR